MMKDKKNLLCTLNRDIPDCDPIWLMRQAGRYLPEYRDLRARAGSFMKLVLDPELAAEVTLQPVKRFGVDGAILFSDILIVPHGLGFHLEFMEGEGPKLETVGEKIPEFSEEIFIKRTKNIYETVGRVAANQPDNTALIGFAGSPFTVAMYMLGGTSAGYFEASLKRAKSDEKHFSRLLDLLVEATCIYLKQQVKAGAEVLQFFDSHAGLAPPEKFSSWITGPTKRIAAEMKKTFPHIPLIGFPRGAGKNIPAYAEGAGIDALSLDTNVDFKEAQETLPPRIVLQGNLDPVLMEGGETPMLRAAETLLKTANRPFVFNLGHGLTPRAKPENVAALADFVHAFRK